MTTGDHIGTSRTVRRKSPRWLACVVILAAVASGCGSGNVDDALLATNEETVEELTASDLSSTGASVSEDSAPSEIPMRPPKASHSEDGTLVMGRANWSSGHIQAQIIHDLVEELGYEVTDPAENEASPDIAYRWMATGKTDFWANSWYPGHMDWWVGDLPNGLGEPADHLVRTEVPMAPGGGLQGWLVTKSWAEAHGVTTIDQINADPDLWQQLDSDGDGKGEFYGCPEDWTCDDIMESFILFAEWNNLEQVEGDYDAMFDEFLAKAEDGDPAIMYTWTPTWYAARAKLGETTMWISILDDSVLDDSNPLGYDAGTDWYCQRCDGVIGYKELGSDVCLYGPDGCQLGWSAASIEITANQAVLEAYPEVHELFNQIRFSAIELSQLGFEHELAGETEEAVQQIATDWINANRGRVDAWLAAARTVEK